MKYAFMALFLTGCATAQVGVCQGVAGYGAAQAIGYPAFLLVLGFTNKACIRVLEP